MVVVSGSNSTTLAKELAEELKMEHHRLEARRFPDSEGYFRVPSDSINKIRSESIILVSNTFPDSGIIETLLLLEALDDVRNGHLSDIRNKDSNLDPVNNLLLLAIPYFGYSRQDKRFNQGEVISAKAIGKMLANKCDGIIVLDLHAPEALKNINLPIFFASSMNEIANYLDSEISPDFILSPDKGAIERASEVATQIGCKFSYLEKTRIDAHTIVHKAKDLDVRDATVVIVDDMISTGGTICKASEALRTQGAKQVHAACTHGLFTGGAIARLDKHVDGVHASNSLLNARSAISAAPALARGVNQIIEQINTK